MQLSNLVHVHKLGDATGSGTTLVASPALDLTRGQGVLFFTVLGTTAADVVGHVAQSLDGGANWQRLEGGSSTTANGNTWACDLYMPRDSLGRLVRVEIERGTATTVGEIWALVYGTRRQNAEQPAGVDLAQLISPRALSA